jgi:glycosyltransferase involved in cell wall biosynthesis
LTTLDVDTISVVISTFERPDACERALRSVLAQTYAPLEVLVCDDGSCDDTPARFAAWERHCEQVRYLRLPGHTGTPANSRNFGVAHARGGWIAFLDDDDEWLPEKLARQRMAMAAETADVIASNALRSDGSLYFQDAPRALRPTRADVLAANPIITSSVLVRLPFAGFPTATWLVGGEDYAAWLSLADSGSRFLILGEPLVRYEDSSADRLSTARAQRELAVALLAWTRAAGWPIDPANVRAAVRKTAGAIHVACSDGLAALGARTRRSAPRGHPR